MSTFATALLSMWIETGPSGAPNPVTFGYTPFADGHDGLLGWKFFTNGGPGADPNHNFYFDCEVDWGDGTIPYYAGSPLQGYSWITPPYAPLTWYHYLVSFDSSTLRFECAINDVLLTPYPGQIANLYANRVLWPTNGNELALPLTSFAHGCQAELYWDTGRPFLDLTVESNRRKFIKANLAPADLGTDGSLPTGSQPQIYCSVRQGQTAMDYLTNRGSLGGAVQYTHGAPQLCGIGGLPT
jgi:hypothetical protein